MTAPRIIPKSELLAERLRELANRVEAREPLDFTWSSEQGQRDEVSPLPCGAKVVISITWPPQ